MPKPTTSYDYRAKIVCWIDGDTVDVDIDFGCELRQTHCIRLYGINAPEIHSEDAIERANAIRAKGACESLAPVGSYVQLKTIKAKKSNKDRKEKYGRYMGIVTNEDGVDIAKALLASGMAKEYFGGKR